MESNHQSTSVPSTLVVTPGGYCCGEISLPGDKSISHRAVMLASLAEGNSTIVGFLPSEDCLATVNAMRALGVTIQTISPTRLQVQGVGLHGLRVPTQAIDCGNAGTLMRLLSGILVGQRFSSELTGDASLCKRPMGRIADPLAQMGANIATTAEETAPLRISPSHQGLQGIRYTLPVASAQVKSSCLLAGLFAQGATVIEEAWPTRDHTERLLQYLSYPIQSKQLGESPYRREITLQGQGKLLAKTIHVPSDISHAAFLLVAACITPRSKIKLIDVGINPTRIGILYLLQEMGAAIVISEQRYRDGEPVATIEIETCRLLGITVPEAWVPLAIDELPAFAVAACFAKGETVLRGASELRHKESDRIAATVAGINALGGRATALADGMIIQGQPLTGGTVDAVGDHRIAMAFAMAGGAVAAPIVIENAAAIVTSWPSFTEVTSLLGMHIQWKNHHA